jgi:hypothetical protein
MTFLAVLAAGAVALASTTHAQEGEGTLRVTMVFDALGTGEYTGGDCNVFVYNLIPDDALFRAYDNAPVAQRSTTATGEAVFSLPPGEYSVRKQCAHTGKKVEGAGVACCRYYDEEPGYRLISRTEGIGHFVVQDVRVNPGEETTASVRESTRSFVNRNQIRMRVLIVLGVLLAGSALTGIWKFRPRYDPKSDPKNPKRLQTKGPEHRRAGFDDVFGDFLKKR